MFNIYFTQKKNILQFEQKNALTMPVKKSYPAAISPLNMKVHYAFTSS